MNFPGVDYSTMTVADDSGNQPNSWLGALGGWMGENSDWLSGLGNTAGQIYSIDRALSEANRISDLGNFINEFANQQGALLNDNAQFKGYGITGTGLGTSTGTVNDNGFNLNFGVGPDTSFANQSAGQTAQAGMGLDQAYARLGNAGGMVNGVNYMAPANQAIQQSLADPSARQQEIYNQMMAMQNPELNRQQALQQAQEYQMGRGGIRGSAYGGTAEDAAMARARADASRMAVVEAMKQADAERTMFGQMGTNYGGLYNQQTQNMTSVGDSLANLGLNQYKTGMNLEELKYLPQRMQLEILQQAQNGVNSQQTGQLTGLGYLTDMMLGGMGTNVNAQKVSAELRGNLYNALLGNLGGATGTDGSSTSGIGGILSAIEGGLDFLDRIF